MPVSVRKVISDAVKFLKSDTITIVFNSFFDNHHDRYGDLHSQSSHRVLQELGEAFVSWYEQDDSDANPPGYRKHGDEHPRSTVTWKNQGFRLDTEYNRVRLSKGTNMKESRYAADYILCEYAIQADDQTLEDIEAVQTVRSVWTGNEWELHFVCEMQMDQPESPGEITAGIDRGICNTAAVSVGDETLLYPGNALKEDAHYFRHKEYDTEGENGPSDYAEWARQKKSWRQEHFLHALSKDIVNCLGVKWFERLRLSSSRKTASSERPRGFFPQISSSHSLSHPRSGGLER